jgi:hypothetical protein
MAINFKHIKGVNFNSVKVVESGNFSGCKCGGLII